MNRIRPFLFLFTVFLGIGCSSAQEGPDEGQDSCYSPTQNLDTAYDEGAVGCACEEGSAGQCVPDSGGRNVALVCEGGHWKAVQDGPCSETGP